HRYLPCFPTRRSSDLPDIYAHFLHILETWGEDAREMVAWEMPSQTGNESFTRWIARLQRLAASPKDFLRQLDSIFALDAGDAPEDRKSTRLNSSHQIN